MLAELASRLPDRPRFVETRGMLLSGRGALLASPGPGPTDFLVRCEDDGLFAVSGRPPLAPLGEAVSRPGARSVLASPEAAASVARALPGWTMSRAIIHTLGGREVSTSSRPRDAGDRVAILSGRDGNALGHLPAPLRREIETALGVSHVAAAFSNDLPVSFCYAAHETETLWDVSVETIPDHRGRGLAGDCCRMLIGHMNRHGKQPVWGALAQNAASLGMARALGFAAVDEIVVFEPPPAP